MAGVCQSQKMTSRQRRRVIREDEAAAMAKRLAAGEEPDLGAAEQEEPEPELEVEPEPELEPESKFKVSSAEEAVPGGGLHDAKSELRAIESLEEAAHKIESAAFLYSSEHSDYTSRDRLLALKKALVDITSNLKEKTISKASATDEGHATIEQELESEL